MLAKLFLMAIAFALGIYVANTYHINLFDKVQTTTTTVEKRAETP